MPSDATAAVLDRIEQYAPGVRDPARLEAYNPTYVGGDIPTGADSLASLAFRPRMALDPYATGIPGVHLCARRRRHRARARTACAATTPQGRH